MSTRAEVSERREAIMAFIKENPNKWFTVNDVPNKANVGYETIRKDIHAVSASLDGSLQTNATKGGGFMYTPYETVVSDEAEDKFKSPWVNHEGYSDPTAKKGIENFLNGSLLETCRFAVGSVWDTTANSKAHELVMVVRSDAVKPIVLPLFEKDEYKTEGNEEYTRKIVYGSYTYYTDIRCLRTKPAKYFLERQFVVEKAKLEGFLIDISRLFTEGNPLLQRRVNVLEDQANKYRYMINDLREQLEKAQRKNVVLKDNVNHAYGAVASVNDLKAEVENLKEQLEKAQKDNEHLTAQNKGLQKINSELICKETEQPVVEDDVKIALALQKQKIDIYEGILKSLGLLGKA